MQLYLFFVSRHVTKSSYSCILLEAMSFILTFMAVGFLYVGIVLSPLSKLLKQCKNRVVRSEPPAFFFFFFPRESYHR